MKTTAKITVMLLVLALVGPASARVITVEVEGVVDLLWTYDGFAFDGSVNIGSAITGFCTYDTDTPDQYPQWDHTGQYSLISISMSIGNYTFTHDPMSSISAIFEISTGNYYFVYSRDPRFDGTVYLDGIPKTFEDFSWTTFGLKLMYLDSTLDEYIPTDELPDLDSWPELSIFDVDKFIGVGTDVDSPGFGISGEITSLTVIPESAMTYYVNAAEGSDNNDGLSPQTAFATIQKAIDSALDGDTVLVADGTYTGPGNRDIDFNGKAITLQSENGPENCIIDCNGTETEPHRGFYFHSGEDLNSVIDGFTITNGHAPGYYLRDGGGAILCENASPTITNCTITTNYSEWNGGGMFCYDSSPTITNCTFKDNLAFGGGGAMLCYSGSPMIANCIIIGNAARGKSDAFVGGVWLVYSGATIRNCTITGNSATNKSAAGICFSSSSGATITNCTIIDNQGSGINCGNSSNTITNCTISRNHGYSGICLRSNSSPLISNCMISGNRSEWRGGGISCFSSSPLINNCTIIGNRADREGGGISAYAGGSSPILANSIVWGNMAANGTEIALKYSSASAPPDIMVLYSAVMGGQAAVYVDENCTLNWGQGNIDADPCFVEPGYWADANDPNIIVEPNDPNAIWIDGDYYLLPDSLCIDAGDPNYVPEPNETDIDGNPRVINGRIDMGAYEFWPPIEAEMKFTPQMLNCNSKGKWIKAHLVLPEGFLAEDVDVNEPAIAEPMNAYSESIKVLGSDKSLVRLEICFDREAFCAQITETGEVEITVIGSLTTSRYFYATDTIKIKP